MNKNKYIYNHNTDQHLQHLLGLRIDFNGIHIQDRLFRDIVISSLTLFFLKLNGNTANSLVLQTFHQMSNEPVENQFI